MENESTQAVSAEGELSDEQFIQRGDIVYGRALWMARQIEYAQLEITAEFLQIRVNAWGIFLPNFKFSRDSITRLSWQRGIFNRGLRIVHSVPEIPRYILFKQTTVPSERLGNALARFHYTIES